MVARIFVMCVLAIFVGIYALGEFSQCFPEDFPWWIRWYMSDAGFVGGFTYTFVSFYLLCKGGFELKKLQRMYVAAVAIIGWLIAVGYEAFVEIVRGRGDLIDVGLFTANLMIVLLLSLVIPRSRQV